MIKKSNKQKVKQYAEWTEEVVAEAMSQGFYSAGHFSHIMRNLTVGLESIISLSEEGEHKFDDEIQPHLKALRTYKKLIETYPEFREGEFLNAGRGYFPDIEDNGKGIVNYAIEAEKRLRGEK